MPVPAGTTVACLVDEFVATLNQHGIAIDRRTVEQEIRDRIADIAARLGHPPRASADIADRLGTSPEPVLREPAGRGWGRQMASGVLTQIRTYRLLPEAPITR